MIYTSLHIRRIAGAIAAMIAAVAVVSCSSDSDTPSHPDGGSTGIIRLGVTTRASVDWACEVSTRDGETRPPIPAVTPETMGVWGFNNRANDGAGYRGAGETFSNKLMMWTGGSVYNNGDNQYGVTSWDYSNEWAYEDPMPWIPSNTLKTTKYEFYAYSPYEPDETVIEAHEKSIGNFQYLIWRNIPLISPTDYLISGTIVQYTSKMPGQQNAVQMIPLRHLMSRVRFCFRIGARFGDLRKIRVKRMRVVELPGTIGTMRANYTEQRDGGGNILTDGNGHTLFSYDCVWSVNVDAGYYSTIDLVNEPEVTSGLGYLELTAENRATPQPLASMYVYAGAEIKAVKIEVDYEIRDLEDNLLRDEHTATNAITLNLSKQGTPGAAHELRPGYYYDVKINVEPKYLYVLSDTDFDADGYLIVDNKDVP